MKNNPDAMQKLANWLDDEIMRLTKENASYGSSRDKKTSNIHKKYALIDVKDKVKELL